MNEITARDILRWLSDKSVDLDKPVKLSLNDGNSHFIEAVGTYGGNLLLTIIDFNLIPQADNAGWLDVDHEDISSGFEEIRLVIHRQLTTEEIDKVAGCLGYALKVGIQGEDEAKPQIIQNNHTGCILDFYYDTATGFRSDPDYDEILATAVHYIHNGTPIRTSNRSGRGTQGTRLVDGIGGGFSMNIFVK